jgi:hypothetical protein
VKRTQTSLAVQFAIAEAQRAARGEPSHVPTFAWSFTGSHQPAKRSVAPFNSIAALEVMSFHGGARAKG